MILITGMLVPVRTSVRLVFVGRQVKHWMLSMKADKVVLSTKKSKLHVQLF